MSLMSQKALLYAFGVLFHSDELVHYGVLIVSDDLVFCFLVLFVWVMVTLSLFC